MNQLSNNRLVKISKFLCKYLRHSPSDIGIELMPGGWVNVDTARQVGSRYGEPVVLIDADKMWQDNFTFYKSDNKVWLVDNVPVEYIYYF